MVATPQADAAKIVRLLESGHPAQAAKAARTAAKKYPKEAYFANLLGMATAQSGKPREAIGHFQKALKLNPALPQASANLAQALFALGQFPQATAVLRRALKSGPQPAEIPYHLARSLFYSGEVEEAIAIASRLIGEAPSNAMFLKLRAGFHAASGDLKSAISDYQAALKAAPDDVEALLGLSTPLALAGQQEAAIGHLEHALRLAPAHGEARAQYGLRLSESGQSDAAIAAYRQVLETAPNNVAALGGLALLLPVENLGNLLVKVEAALRKMARSSRDRVGLIHAKADALRRLGDGEKAARARAEAKALDKGFNPYDRDGEARLHKAIVARFAKARRAQPGEGTPPTPVFVVGQMRSGTTLTEQVLAAHPAIHGVGELASTAFLLRHSLDLPGAFSPDEAEALARGYRDLLPPLPDGTAAFVDKMPANYRHVGHLAEAFADARFIHVTRDPRDVALSIWNSFFAGRGLSFTNDFKDMAHHANLYRATMNHWQALYRERILTMPYADLVGDIETASRRMADFVGLEWDDAMMRPEENAGVVRSASFTQVRQSVHTKSIGRWKANTDLLAPFIAGLDPELWPDLPA